VVEETPEGVWVDVTPTDLRGRPPLVSIIPGEVDPHRSFVWGPTLRALKAGQVGSFHVILCDRYGNLVGQSAGDVQVELTQPYDPREPEITRRMRKDHPVIIHGKRRLRRDGTYVFSYEHEAAGAYTGRIYVNGVDMTSLQFTAHITATNIAPLKCLAHGEGLVKATAGVEAKFTVEVRDLYNNRKTTGGDRVAAYVFPKGLAAHQAVSAANPNSLSIRADMHWNEDGTYTAAYMMQK
jgi:hypothetical protein